MAIPPEGVAQTLNPQSQMIQHIGHPAHADMTDSSHVKTECQVSPQLQGQLSPTGQVHYPQDVRELQGLVKTVPAADAKSTPGPILAANPLVLPPDRDGVQRVTFEYSKDSAKMQYTVRCDVESVDTDELSPKFKEENCVYPRACDPTAESRGNRWKYETECNRIAWGLAQLNIPLRCKRGLLQRAVDTWRNSNKDPRLWSRRVRRLAKEKKRHNFCGCRANPR
ncbi:hypothetical protein FANTH_12258 [Fusarium anthophilum]|uniref:DUF8032 domain-containing protein n=1 Tax=Fusarium anthophilum TaxID=48485 RepID=A0A8H5DSP7_9HYPO|nr:hypothetical protein FANTH_12258 [Fusarium anthophilum]